MTSPPQPPLKPPQFSLRTLFLAVTLAACFCALAISVSPLVLSGVVFIILSLVAHVVGNKLGTILRDHGSQQRQNQPTQHSAAQPRASDFAPRTQLGQRQSLGLVSVALTLIGITLGGGLSVAGALWLYAHPTPADLIVVGIAGAVLGGIWTFAIAGFFQVGASAAWQASRTPEKQNAEEHLKGSPPGS